MSVLRAKIQAERERIKAHTGLGEGHREALSDMLLTAYEASNGAPDKLQALTEALASQAICIARDAVHRREDFAGLIDAALLKHRELCPLKGRDVSDITASGTAGKAAAWVRALKPALWPAAVFLSVGALSPYVGPELLAWLKGVIQ